MKNLEELTQSVIAFNIIRRRPGLIVLLLVVLWLGSKVPLTYADPPEIFINEILAANAATNLDPDNYNFVDWIEIYNAGDQAVDLAGYYLTDDLTNPTKWQIPAGATIEAGDYELFWADGTDQDHHTNFELNGNGEEIALYDPAQTLIDTVTYEAQLPDISFGRQPDGNANWFYFGEPSPAGPNNTGGIPEKAVAAVPQFSLPGGFYQGSQTVELSAVSPGAEIRYTLDGSIPDAGSALYSAPLNFSSTTVIRARSFETGYLPSPVLAQTYFIDQDFSLPVISIATTPANLWDDEIGIYVEGTNGIPGNGSDTPMNWNQDWERPINLEFYETDGNPAFNMQAGVKIFGGFTRKKPQKSLAIYARDRYGADTVDYQLFADKSIDEFKTFLLRSSGNGQKTMFRDAMMHTLVKHLDIDLQAYRPAIVFLNGDYWGIHNIREKLNEHYLASNHDVDPNNVDLLEKYGKVHEGDADHYEALLDFVETNDMTLPQNYEYVRTQMEVDEYLTYQIAELYYANTDWPDNNIKFWRPKTATGRWRWLLYDTDFGFQMAKVDRDKIPAETDSDEATILLRNLLENPDFQNDFIQRFASHINITFQPDRVISIIDELRANIAAEMPGHIDKWDEPSSMDKWEEEIETDLREFARQRPANVRQHILDRFGLSGTVNLTLNVESEQGKILVGAVEAPAPDFTGLYFKDVPLQLRAVPKPGYRFASWQGAGGAIDPTADTIWITLTADTTITALFEEVVIEDNDPLVINEIHYNPAAAQGSDDDYEFVELYNRSGSPVDLAGYAFTDGIVFTFTTGSTIAAGEHIVLAKNAATYSGQGYSVFQWSSGSLSNGGENLELRNSVGNIADIVPYDDLSPWPEEPDGNGPSLELIDPVLDNALPANWEPSNGGGGTPGQANSGSTTNAPQANDDIVATLQDVALTISVLDNDIDLDNDTLTVTAVGMPTAGAAAINSPSTASYLPNSGFTGIDHFTYTVSDPGNLTDVATVTVIVNAAGTHPLVINEIHYNPAAAQGSDDDYEFVELYNRSESPVDLAGYAFTDGIVFTFTTGSTIAAGEHIVLAKNAATYSGQGYSVFQWSSGSLSNGGENLELRNSVGNIADIVSYDDLSPWPEEPDGNGPSLELIDPVLDNALPANWKPSNGEGGTPGQANSAVMSEPVNHAYLPLVIKNN